MLSIAFYRLHKKILARNASASNSDGITDQAIIHLVIMIATESESQSVTKLAFF
jgi:hypothetical protein